MKNDAEISLAYLDILSCALAGMLMIFFVFSLFDRQGDASAVQARIISVSASSQKSVAVSDDKDVRYFIADIGDCQYVPSADVDKVIVSRLSGSRIGILVKSTDAVSIPLQCGAKQTVSITSVRSPDQDSAPMQLLNAATLSYDRSRGWSAS